MHTDTIVIIGHGEPCPTVTVDAPRPSTRLACLTLTDTNAAEGLTLWAPMAVLRELADRLADALDRQPQQCVLCGGEGTVDDTRCGACQGTGTTKPPANNDDGPAWDVIATVTRMGTPPGADIHTWSERVHAYSESGAREVAGQLLAADGLMLEEPLTVEPVRTEASCATCGGHGDVPAGQHPDTRRSCPDCHGSGQRQEVTA